MMLVFDNDLNKAIFSAMGEPVDNIRRDTVHWYGMHPLGLRVYYETFVTPRRVTVDDELAVIPHTAIVPWRFVIQGCSRDPSGD